MHDATIKITRQDLSSVPAVLLYAVSILAEVQRLGLSNDEGFEDFLVMCE
jgi:hypothetical protein